jgi:hypothetical protein
MPRTGAHRATSRQGLRPSPYSIIRPIPVTPRRIPMCMAMPSATNGCIRSTGLRPRSPGVLDLYQLLVFGRDQAIDACLAARVIAHERRIRR